jgi:alkyl sulfatase BDS1-like metallo-beta-lactamase superfamily hydrolase
MGGAEALLAAAQRSFDEGDYRWVAELLNHLVFADPSNTAARELQADTFEQLGYQSESATFRNAYLTGAQELRNGTLPSRPVRRTGYQDAMTVEQMFDTLAVRLRAEDVGGMHLTLNFTFTDVDEMWVLGLSNRALHAVRGRHDEHAAATMRLTRAQLLAVIDGEGSWDSVESTGDVAAADAIFGNLDTFISMFPLVEP